MPYAFLGVMLIYGVAMLVFAFLKPPSFLESFFRVPAIFVFLPKKWVIPAGRVFVALCCFGVIYLVYGAIAGHQAAFVTP